MAVQEFCTRISATKFQWVSRCKIQFQKWARNSMPGRGSPLLFLGRNFARESRFQATRAASAYKVAYLASPQNIGAETICPVWRSGATSLNGQHGRKPSV